MKQEDYILREIEKIGTIVRAILGRITSKEHSEAITIGKEFEQTTEWMLQETNFDLLKVLSLEKDPLKDYLSAHKGFNTTNLELLAEIFHQTGILSPESKKEKFLRKALQLYELCNETDHTYSFERERKMKEIKEIL